MSYLKKILNYIRGEQSLRKLQKRGLIIGKNFKRMGECVIDPSHCWHIEIGDDVILAPRVHILAHDASTKLFTNYTKVGNVKIGCRVFVGAGTIILPGVTIGNDVAIGAGSIVSKDIPSNSLAVGMPAKVISTLTEYIEKEKTKMNENNCFSVEFTLRNKDFSDVHKRKVMDACKLYKKIFVE